MLIFFIRYIFLFIYLGYHSSSIEAFQSYEDILIVGCFCNRENINARATRSYNTSVYSALLSSSISLESVGFKVTSSVATCEDPSSFNVLNDSRISASARISLLRRTRRSWADIAENRHVTTFLCHLDALSIISKSRASIGIVMFGETFINMSTSELYFNLPIITTTAAQLLAFKVSQDNIHTNNEQEKDIYKFNPNIWDMFLLETGTIPQAPFSYLYNSGKRKSDCEGQILSTASWSSKTSCFFDSFFAAVLSASSSLVANNANKYELFKSENGLQKLPKLQLVPGPWKQMSSYAITNYASKLILTSSETNINSASFANSLSINVRWDAFIASLSELDFLKVVYLPLSNNIEQYSISDTNTLNKDVYNNHLVTRMNPLVNEDEDIDCDLCDLPIRYDRVAVINGNILTGLLIGLLFGFLIHSFSCELVSSFFQSFFSSLETTMSAQTLQVRFLYSMEFILHNPCFLLLLFFLFGYNIAFETSREPWPSSRFQSIELVSQFPMKDSSSLDMNNVLLPSLPLEIETLWDEFVISMTNATVHHATVATRSHPNLDRLSSTALWHENSIIVMGGNDTKRFPKWGAGFGVKLELVHSLLKSLPQDDILLFTDAFDVLLMQSHTFIRNAFLAAVRLKLYRQLQALKNKDTDTSKSKRDDSQFRIPSIFFSAEFFCHPDPERQAEYPLEDRIYSSFAYLNSGTYIGRVGSLLDAMDRSPNYTLQDDDQRYWTNLYLSSLDDISMPRIELDHEHDVFLCMNKYRADGDLQFDPARRLFSFSGKRDRLQGGNGGGDSMESRGIPSIIHFNGRKDDVESFFTALSGYNIAPNINYTAEPVMSLWEHMFVSLRNWYIVPNISYYRFKYLIYGEKNTFWTPYTLSGNKSLQAILIAIFFITIILGVAVGRVIEQNL